MSRTRNLLVGLLLCATPAWCGRNLPSGANEQSVSDELIVRLKPGNNIAAILARFVPNAQVRSLAAVNLHLLKVPGGLPPGLAAVIASALEVHYVEPNRVRSTKLNPANDPGLPQQWALSTIQAAQAWGLMPNQFLTSGTAGPTRMKIAVLDTGTDCTHPDFMNAGGTSTNAAQGGQLSFALSQAVVATTVSPAACAWQDDYGHGTHVSGIIAAAANNGVGVAGLGYPVQIVTYKILDSKGSGTDFDIASAIMSAADAGVQVISMSLGGVGYSQSLETAIDYAWQRNVLVVAAAGNGATSQLTFPAGATHAIGVAATDSANNTAGFSNFGDYVEISAPGVSVLSTLPTYATPIGGTNYGSLSGTSMATPYVAALGGLIALTTPGVAAASVAQRIEQSASSFVAGGGWDAHVGYGLINAYNAVKGTIRNASLGALRGQITDSSGLPLGAQVLFNGQTVSTDASTGLFRFPSVAPGTYTISVSSSGYPGQTLTATVAPGADTILPVAMGAAYGQFTGTVLDQGVGIPYAIVQAIGGSPAVIQGTTTADASGNYVLWVPPGPYTLRASAVSRSGAAAAASVTAGGSAGVNLQLARLGKITGHVSNGSGQALANAQVSVAVGSMNNAGATSDTNGNYTTIGVPAGTYAVTASIAGPQSATVAGVTVAPDVDSTANITIGGSSGGAAATFVKTDTTTQGNWRSSYGAEGFNVIGDLASNPTYASPTASGQLFYVWAGSTSDPRALQKVSNPSDRIAATWFSGSSFVIDLNNTDQATHQIALYCADWDSTTRRQTVDVMDVNGNVLNTQVLNYNYTGGVYLVWNITGHVKLRMTWNGGYNAVVEGLFFGGPLGQPAASTATFVKADTTTQGNWRSSYGADGYNVIGDLASNPSYASPAPSGQDFYVWAGSTQDVRGVQKVSNPADRIAATWFSGNSFMIDLNISDQAVHQFALYCVDWDSTTRRQTVDVLDLNGNVLNTQVMNYNYTGGVYLVWNLSGHVRLRMTWNAGYNAVVSGLFFGGPLGAPAAPTATFVRTDTATQGNWLSSYGADGYTVIGDLALNPSYASPVVSGQDFYTWAASTSDIRGLQKPSNTADRLASTWFSANSFMLDLNVADQAQHQIALYCVDWDSTSRRQTVEVLDTSGNLLNSQALTSDFSRGVYLVWNISGHVKLRITWNAGYNAVISGLFFR